MKYREKIFVCWQVIYGWMLSNVKKTYQCRRWVLNLRSVCAVLWKVAKHLCMDQVAEGTVWGTQQYVQVINTLDVLLLWCSVL